MTRSAAATQAKSAARKKHTAKKAARKPLKPIFARPKTVAAVKLASAATPSRAKPLLPEPVPAAPKKPKIVRDSFTMPKSEYAALDQMKLRARVLGRQVKKSELLRAGLTAIAALGDAAFIAAIDVVPRIKTGRPKQAKSAAEA